MATLSITYWDNVQNKQVKLDLDARMDVLKVTVAAQPGDEDVPNQPELEVNVNTDAVIVDAIVNGSKSRIATYEYSDLLAEAAGDDTKEGRALSALLGEVE